MTTPINYILSTTAVQKDPEFDQVITYDPLEVKYFSDIKEAWPIPTNSIIHKTTTGIGATHGEIIAPRNSIIVLPHIAAIKSKHHIYETQFDQQYHTLPIYGEVTPDDILDYLNHCKGQHWKLLTTPKGVIKLVRMLEILVAHGKVTPNFRDYFFVLIDECQKLVQDSDYRDDMIELMNHFFDFPNKAMVSATPIKPSDPNFEKHNFRHIKVTPNELNRKEIEIINTNSIINTLQKYFVENINSCYCIFFSSVEGIKAVITGLKLSDTQIFCSKESTQLLLLNNDIEALSEFREKDLKTYNFFTSSFFTGLDMHLSSQPDIILLTDNGYRKHTLLDLYTDVLQIIGRIREHKVGPLKDLPPYRKITHINNSAHFTNPITTEQALENVAHSKAAYEHLLTLRKSITSLKVRPYLDQALTTVKPYASLLTKKQKQFSYYLQDNYLDDEQVKWYYKGAGKLISAYMNSRLYSVTYKKSESYEKKEFKVLSKQSIRYSAKMNKMMADTLLELEDYKGLDAYYEGRDEVERLSKDIFDAYERLGYEQLLEMKFSKKKIDTAMLKVRIADGLNHYGFASIVYRTFKLNRYYTHFDVKEGLREAVKEFNLDYTIKSTDIERFFTFKDTKKNGQRVYVFLERKINPVSQPKHV